MDWNEIEGDWKRYKGNIREQWGNLTDEELDEIDGNRRRFETTLQDRYHLTPEQVRAQIDEWYQKLLRNL